MTHNQPLMKNTLPSALSDALSELFFFGGLFTTSQAVCERHGRDESPYPMVVPSIFAHTNAEVADFVRLCNQYAFPVIPYGAESSLEGHLLPIHGGISLDLSGMNRILDVIQMTYSLLFRLVLNASNSIKK